MSYSLPGSSLRLQERVYSKFYSPDYRFGSFHGHYVLARHQVVGSGDQAIEARLRLVYSALKLAIWTVFFNNNIRTQVPLQPRCC